MDNKYARQTDLGFQVQIQGNSIMRNMAQIYPYYNQIFGQAQVDCGQT